MEHQDNPNRTPLVSVIIPTFERPDFVRRAIESVLTQTESSLECLVVNDGGTPLGPLPGDRRLRVLESPMRLGPGSARNVGLRAAIGDFVCFLDDDDFFEPTRVEVGLQLTQRAPIGVVNWMTRDRAQRGHARFDGDFTKKVVRGHWPAVGQALIPRSRCVEFSDLRVSEDFEWWLRMSRDARFAYTREPLLVIERHSAHRVGIERLTRFECRKEILARHADVFDADRQARASATERIAAAALAAGLASEAKVWAARSLAAFPNLTAAKVLVSSVRQQRRTPEKAAAAGLSSESPTKRTGPSDHPPE